MKWSIVFPTHNRRDTALANLARLRELEPAADEIVVCADGCTDGTAGAIREQYPEVRVMETCGVGSVGARDALMRAARGEWVLSLDDDSYPVERDILGRMEEVIVRMERVVVFWFPQRSEEFPETLAEGYGFGSAQWTGSYMSGGACLRRSAYLEMPGYPALFFHAYEEPDYGLQVLAWGRGIVFWPGVHVYHAYSPVNRNEVRTHHLHSRNEQWSIWMRCPWPWWPLISLRRAVGQFGYACKRGPRWVLREPLWWVRALAGFCRVWGMRNPVPWGAYRKWMGLLRHPEPVVPVELSL